MNAARTLLWLCRVMLVIVYVTLVLWLMACPLLPMMTVTSVPANGS